MSARSAGMDGTAWTKKTNRERLVFFYCIFVVGRAGFEPATNGLKIPEAVPFAHLRMLIP